MTRFTLSNNSCTCTNGYISINKCLSCISNCLNCVNSSGCITCAPGYFLYQNLCIVQKFTFLINNVDSIRYLRMSSDYKTVYAFSYSSIRIYNLTDSSLILKQTINTQLYLFDNYDQV